ncbi:MAG: glycosyltransferase family 2 protein [Flavobacteriales bacterium]
MELSLVIPLYNEEESLIELFNWIKKTLSGREFEVIFVDDGSTDDSWKVVSQLADQYTNVIGIRFRRNYGKSAGLNVGFEAARGQVVVTMDADLQDNPEEIPEMERLIVEEGFDLISGWKKVRHDPITKTIPTKLYNWATRKMSGIYLHDFNCGLKAYKKDVVKSIEVYGEMHRYIPILAKKEGYKNIGEKVVQHQARKYGTTKFGWERFINGFLDLLTISFISRFGKKPMHLFGTLGSIMFVLGFFLLTWIGGEKLYLMQQNIVAKNITEISGFYIALVAMIVGAQFFLAGFLGELISRNSPNRNYYQVRSVTKTYPDNSLR